MRLFPSKSLMLASNYVTNLQHNLTPLRYFFVNFIPMCIKHLASIVQNCTKFNTNYSKEYVYLYII